MPYYYYHTTTSPAGPTSFIGITDFNASVPTDKGTPLVMNTTKGIAQSDVSGVINNGGSAREVGVRIFVSPALAAKTLIGGQVAGVGCSVTESSGNANLYMRWYAYVWRPGVGKVKALTSSAGDGVITCPTEHGTSIKECMITFDTLAGNYDLQNEDRIVVEMCWYLNNTKSTNYTLTSSFDGSDISIIDGNDPSAGQASGFLYLAQTLDPYTPPSSAIKTINGLAIASVKTVNALAIASVKTWNGLACWGGDLLRRWLKEKHYENIFNLAHSSIRYPMFRRRAA